MCYAFGLKTEEIFGFFNRKIMKCILISIDMSDFRTFKQNLSKPCVLHTFLHKNIWHCFSMIERAGLILQQNSLDWLHASGSIPWKLYKKGTYLVEQEGQPRKGWTTPRRWRLSRPPPTSRRWSQTSLGTSRRRRRPVPTIRLVNHGYCVNQ